MSQELEFFATCPKGFEKLLAQELDGLRIKKVRPLGGQVAFYGSLACNRLHRRMHAGHIVDAFLSIRDGLSRTHQRQH